MFDFNIFQTDSRKRPVQKSASVHNQTKSDPTLMLNRIKSNNSSKQTKDFKEKEKEVVEFDFGG